MLQAVRHMAVLLRSKRKNTKCKLVGLLLSRVFKSCFDNDVAVNEDLKGIASQVSLVGLIRYESFHPPPFLLNHERVSTLN